MLSSSDSSVTSASMSSGGGGSVGLVMGSVYASTPRCGCEPLTTPSRLTRYGRIRPPRPGGRNRDSLGYRPQWTALTVPAP
jgi:hypothetical protein